MEDILNLAPEALFSFGAVWVVGLRVKLTTEQKFALSAVAFFVYGFVPANLGNEIANLVKDAIAGAVGVAAFYQGAKGVKKA